MVLSCAVENSYEPMRFAGTWKQYSKNAMPQLARMTFHSASLRYLRWPYQAKVMKIFDMVSSKIVRTIISGAQRRYSDAAKWGTVAKRDHSHEQARQQGTPCYRQCRFRHVRNIFVRLRCSTGLA